MLSHVAWFPGSPSETLRLSGLLPNRRLAGRPYMRLDRALAHLGKHRLSAKREPDIQFAVLPIKNEM
jgi:hypothetical protein